MVFLLLELILFTQFIPHGYSKPDVDIDIDAYCKLKCPYYRTKMVHTVCEWRCQIAPDCVDFKAVVLTDRDRQYILDLHNFARNLIASGRDQRGGNNKAKNMMVMNYDMEIEKTALCWARRCVYAHDNCRHALSHETAGQNMYKEASKEYYAGNDRGVLNRTVMAWYNTEIEQCNKKIIQVYPKSMPITRFAQIVWATTRFVGCASVTLTKPDLPLKYKVHIFCNYSPTGILVGHPVYQFGSGCEDQPANKDHPSLCGVNKILSTDRDPRLIGQAVNEQIQIRYLVYITVILYLYNYIL